MKAFVLAHLLQAQHHLCSSAGGSSQKQLIWYFAKLWESPWRTLVTAISFRWAHEATRPSQSP